MSDRPGVRTDPLNAEASPLAWSSAMTPTAQHYVRSNFPVPQLDKATDALTVDAAVATPLTLSLAALRARPQDDVIVTMECAGNDRMGIRPLPPSEPWQSGAVSTANWRGVRLRDLLLVAELHEEAVEIVAEGADRGPREDAATADDVTFARALPREVVLHPDSLLALELNGEPLPQLHGAPRRLLVPGWYGMAAVKWVTRARVKSMINSPTEGEVLDAGTVAVHGWARSGDGAITPNRLGYGNNAVRPVVVEVRGEPSR